MITFCIPCAPYHKHLLDRAVNSVKAQTVPCEFITLIDEDKRGPGWARNRMTEQVKTEFISYLDSDDWVEPTFAADTIAEYRRIGGDKYIFTDWYDNRGEVVQTPCLNGPDGYPLSVPDRKPYCDGTWHIITTLIPTGWMRDIGGFNESIPGFEDTEMYLNLCSIQRCGHHLAKPLFHYAPNGGRALAFLQRPDHEQIKLMVAQRYGGHMACCGADETVLAVPIGTKQDGDVLAMALWHGNRGESGRVTRRRYPRISFPKAAWVDPRDVAQSPTLWKVVEQSQPAPIPQPGLNLAQLAQAGLATARRVAVPDYAPPKNEPPPPPVQSKPNVSRVMRLASRQPPTDDPIFVFPEKDYPSYSDIKRLVALSGFDSRTVKQIDAFSRQPLIIVSPESLPDLSGIKARVIAWQLEYAGDYTHNYDAFAGEVWASDKAWADAHGARYVLMGSHEDLGSIPVEAFYDVSLLGYMVNRRNIIKQRLAHLRWTPDYPGHQGEARDRILKSTRLILNVHQHEGSNAIAPQRIAIAAAYHLPVLSETVSDPGDLSDCIHFASYESIPDTATHLLDSEVSGDALYELLCVRSTFRINVERALRQ